MREKHLESLVAIVVGLTFLGLVFSWKLFFLLAVVVGLTGLLSKKLLGKISQFWLSLSNLLGGVVSKVILFFVFFLILTPLSFIYRFFGNDTLQLKKVNTQSYYRNRGGYLFKAKDLEKPW